jgi:hypothetical protein
MRNPRLWLVAVLTMSACANVERLSLNDSRLPLEARRWLADAEDEVAIRSAQVVDAERALAEMDAYRDNLLGQLERAWLGKKKSSGSKSAFQAFVKYTDTRKELMSAQLDLAMEEYRLAEMRLTQVRAETAVQYDLDVYEMGPIIAKVQELRKGVANMTDVVEKKRIEMEKTAAAAWNTYASFVRSGGVSNAMWFTPELRAP